MINIQKIDFDGFCNAQWRNYYDAVVSSALGPLESGAPPNINK